MWVFTTALKQIRMYKSLNQKKFAEKIGVPRSSYCDAENGNRCPNVEFIRGIATAFPDINVDWLLTGKGEMLRDERRIDNSLTVEELMPVGERIRIERERVGKTQAEIAKEMGVSRKTQIAYESGTTEPKASYVTGLERLGFDFNYVATGNREGTAMQRVINSMPEEIYNALADLMPNQQAEILNKIQEIRAGNAQIYDVMHRRRNEK